MPAFIYILCIALRCVVGRQADVLRLSYSLPSSKVLLLSPHSSFLLIPLAPYRSISTSTSLIGAAYSDDGACGVKVREKL